MRYIPHQQNEINADGVHDVDGIVKDALVHEEKAVSYLQKINENLEGALGSIDQASGGIEAVAEKLSDGFMREVGGTRLLGTQGIQQLVANIDDVKNTLNSAIDALNNRPSLLEDLDEAFHEDPALAILGASIAAMTTLLGAAGGAAAGPAGMVAGGVAGAAIGANLTGELAADRSSNLLSLVASINDLVDELGGFSQRIDQAADWLHAEISQLDDEQPEF